MQSLIEYFLSLSVKKIMAVVAVANVAALAISVGLVYLLTTI